MTSITEAAVGKGGESTDTQSAPLLPQDTPLNSEPVMAATNSESTSTTTTTTATTTLTTATTTTPPVVTEPTITTSQPPPLITTPSTTMVTTMEPTTTTATTTSIATEAPVSEPVAAPVSEHTSGSKLAPTTDTLIDNNNSQTTSESNTYYDFSDNGIFDFMTPEIAIELYHRIHTRGLPDLDWKFYGRRKPGDLMGDPDDKAGNQCDKVDGMNGSSDLQDQDANGGAFNNTEFDFDVDSFAELQAETSAISDSLQLKRRPEPGSERKANLSDIMSDILKETSHMETE